MQAAIFPGQGTQYVKMGHELYQTFPFVRDLFQEAEDCAELPLKKIMFEGPDDILRQTQYAQLALFVMSAALLKILKEEYDVPIEQFSFVAGHSSGEYTAYYAANVLSFSDVLTLLKARSRAMSKITGGGMLAVIGLSFQEIETLISQLQEKNCAIANDNAPGQIVISGTLHALARISEQIREMPHGKNIFLNVSGPFHSFFMQPAQEQFLQILNTITFNSASIPIITNVSAIAQSDANVLRQDLSKQISSPVLWRSTQLNLYSYGATSVVEIGAGKVLTNLLKKTIPNMKTYTINTLESIHTWLSDQSLKCASM
jgi:[acyl-carrier-protein] S-malonyltransferase